MTDKDNTPVAGYIVTRCTKCKLELGHVVVSHNKIGVVNKVKCHTCGSEHKYYSEKKKVERKKKIVSAKKKKVNSDAVKYVRLLEQNKDKAAIPYGISGTFNLHDIIDHKTFGKGVVSEVHDRKIEVLFETKKCILACNR